MTALEIHCPILKVYQDPWLAWSTLSVLCVLQPALSHRQLSPFLVFGYISPLDCYGSLLIMLCKSLFRRRI